MKFILGLTLVLMIISLIAFVVWLVNTSPILAGILALAVLYKIVDREPKQKISSYRAKTWE